MIIEEKNIDFYTTGRQLSEQEFAKISEWIKRDKQRKKLRGNPLQNKSISDNKGISKSVAGRK
jgi:hypothetical protein